MKIVGIMMQRDELDIVLYNVLHHLDFVGLDQFIVADNGSTDGSLEALYRLAETEPRLRVVEMAGPYDQARRVNSLYQMALENDADWVVPLDADEFLPVGRDRLERALDQCLAPAIRINVRNFVQSHSVDKRDITSIAKIRFFARPRGSSGKSEYLVNSGELSYIESRYPKKYIWRANKNLRIHKGNHGGDGVGPDRAKSRITLYHAPIRSRAHLEMRRKRIARLDTTIPAQSWHTRRLSLMTDQQLAREWQVNSAWFGVLWHGRRIRLLWFSPFFPKLVSRYERRVNLLLGEGDSGAH
ncbi:MAG: glycosyltransferase family 2 protein [Bradyrhizobiaceae bacterium]|nr:MAG: glycosyltransferase family 2 protein [Bradyrhizobiaceae bacterium]